MKMSLAALDRYSLRLIFALVDFDALARLNLSGNANLRLKMRQEVHQFEFHRESCSPVSCDALIASFMALSSQQDTFRLADWDRASSDLVRETVDWSRLPTTITALTIPSRLSFDLRSSLPLRFPSLRSLSLLRDLPTLSGYKSDAILQSVDTELLYHLPSTLTHLSIDATLRAMVLKPPMFDWSELPLEYVSLPKLRCTFVLDYNAWRAFPSSLRHLQVEIVAKNRLLEAPPSFALLFPQLIRLVTAQASYLHCAPSSETSALSILPSSLTVAGKTSSFEPWQYDQLITLGRLYGSQLRSLPKGRLSYAQPLSKFTHLKVIRLSYDMTDFRSIPLAKSFSCFPFLESLHTSSLDRSEFDTLPPSLTSLAVAHNHWFIATSAHLPLPSPNRCWPPLLRKLDLSLEFHLKQVLFDLSILPPTLQSFRLKIRRDRPNDAQAIVTEFSYFLEGSLAHLTRLEILDLNIENENLKAVPYFNTPSQLPRSLTYLNTTTPCFSHWCVFPQLTPTSPWPLFENLTTLIFGRRPVPTKLSLNIGEPVELYRDDHHVSSDSGDVADDPAEEMKKLERAFNDTLDLLGINTQIIHLLPKCLEVLSFQCHHQSQPWNDAIIKALPRKLFFLELLGGASIPFEGATASCLAHLPPKLDQLTFTCNDEGEASTTPISHQRCTPPDFMDHLPRSIPTLKDSGERASAQADRFCAYWREKMPSHIVQ